MRIVVAGIRRLDLGLAWCEKGLLVLFLTVMIVLSFSQVILRNFFDTAIPAGDVINRHLVLWLGFLGASLAAQKGRHIRIELLTRILTGTALRWVEVLLDASAVVICYLFFSASWRFVMDEREFSGILFGPVPFWVAEIIIPAGFLILTFRFAFQAFQRLAGLDERGAV